MEVKRRMKWMDKIKIHTRDAWYSQPSYTRVFLSLTFPST